MDDRRFDALTRRLAAAVSRRGMTAAAVGGALAALAGAEAGEANAARQRDRRGGGDGDGREAKGGAGGKDAAENGTVAANAADRGADDARRGRRTCRRPGKPCKKGDRCCGGACRQGRCVCRGSRKPCGPACIAGDACCTGNAEGCPGNQTCVDGACAAAGGCTSDADCTGGECQTGTCGNGTCAYENKDNGTECGSGAGAGVCCGGACNAGKQCCSDAQCGGGTPVCSAAGICVCPGGGAICGNGAACCAAGQVCRDDDPANECCTRASEAETCAGKCGPVIDNCGFRVECGTAQCTNNGLVCGANNTCVCTPESCGNGGCCEGNVCNTAKKECGRTQANEQICIPKTECCTLGQVGCPAFGPCQPRECVVNENGNGVCSNRFRQANGNPCNYLQDGDGDERDGACLDGACEPLNNGVASCIGADPCGIENADGSRGAIRCGTTSGGATCLCFSTIEGAGFCVKESEASCRPLDVSPACERSADCPADHLCMPLTGVTEVKRPQSCCPAGPPANGGNQEPGFCVPVSAACAA